MSYTFGLTIESMVAILLLLTIIYCARLNSRLEKLRADERVMRATISELVGATENAERAIAGLKLTLQDCEGKLGGQLQEAEVFSAAIADHLKSGEDVLARLRLISEARKHLPGGQEAAAPPASPPAADTKAMVAAAQAFAERARSRARGVAA